MNSPLRLMLLDDSTAERELLMEAVHAFGDGIELLTVATPDEAERGLVAFAPTLMLIDLHLGRWHGRDLLSLLRGRVLTVILTTTDDPAEASRCLAAGALAFWVKPQRFDDFAELFTRIRALIAEA